MKRACVIGWPVEHSRSPDIHRYWLKRYGIDGTYEKEAVPPEAVAGFLGSLAERGYAGCNVTLPHKETALRIADNADDDAKAIGAANMLWLDKEGRLNAGNSDSYGFMTALENAAPGWKRSDRAVMVLGAGGAARAVLHGLLKSGDLSVLLANRTRDRAAALAKDFGSRIEVVDWDERSARLGACGLLVNTTSLGMSGKAPLEIDLRSLPLEAVVVDIVYSPLETALLAAARARGNRVLDGLGMLLYQAVPAFERFFGVRPEVTPELRAAIAASLA